MSKIITKSLKISHSLVTDSKKPQHFAFIFKRNKLLSIGQNNMDISHPKAIKFAKLFGAQKPKEFPYVHAEIDAISKLWGKIYVDKSLSLVSVRLNRFLDLRNSKPCVDCSIVINSLSIPTYYFDGHKWRLSNDS